MKSRTKTIDAAGQHRDQILDGARRIDTLPRWIEPLAPTEVSETPSRPALAEIKFDGYRALVTKDGDQVRIWSRNEKEMTHLLPTIVAETRKLACRRLIIDAELCVLTPDGHSQFHLIPSALGPRARLRPTLLAFDLLAIEEHDIRPIAIERRKALLEELLASADGSTLRNVPAVEGHADEVFAFAARTGLEGIVFKQPGSPYASGRSRLWLKRKCRQAQAMVVGGFKPAGRELGELLLGVRSGSDLYYVGTVSTGLDRVAGAIAPKLEGLRQLQAPFEATSLGTTRGIWVRPEVSVVVKFTATSMGRMRHPSVVGLPDSTEVVVPSKARSR